jgi:hypothetical protein
MKKAIVIKNKQFLNKINKKEEVQNNTHFTRYKQTKVLRRSKNS